MAQPHAADDVGSHAECRKGNSPSQGPILLSAAMFSTCATFDTTHLVFVNLFIFTLLRGLEHDVTRRVAHNACASIITARSISCSVEYAGSFHPAQKRVLISRNTKNNMTWISPIIAAALQDAGVFVLWNGCASTPCLVSNTGPIQTASIHSTIPPLSNIIRRPSGTHMYIVAL